MFQAIEVSFIDFVQKVTIFTAISHVITSMIFFLPGFTNHCVTLLVLMVLFSLCDISTKLLLFDKCWTNGKCWDNKYMNLWWRKINFNMSEQLSVQFSLTKEALWWANIKDEVIYDIFCKNLTNYGFWKNI